MASYPDKPSNVKQPCTDIRRDWQRLMLECLGNDCHNPRQISIVLPQHHRVISTINKYDTITCAHSKFTTVRILGYKRCFIN